MLSKNAEKIKDRIDAYPVWSLKKDISGLSKTSFMEAGTLVRLTLVSEKDNTDQIVEYLKTNTDIRVVYPYEELMRFKEKYPDEPLYYHLDTHWNELGAYIGAKALQAGKE